MSKKIRDFTSKYLRYSNRDILKEYVGDAALKFLIRLVLQERYYFLPVCLLSQREQLLLTNKELYKYCLRHKTGFGSNRLEKLIAEKTLNNLNEAKAIVEDILNNNKPIKELDKLHVKDGKLSTDFINDQILKSHKRVERASQSGNRCLRAEQDLIFFKRLSENLLN